MSTKQLYFPGFQLLAPINESLKAASRQATRVLRAHDKPQEWQLISLRECSTPSEAQECSSAEHVANYWWLNVCSHPYFNNECECIVVILLNVRKLIKGHVLVGIGTIDTVVTHAREIYRVAVMASAHSIIVAHNHPSGDPSPSDADIVMTRNLMRAGQLLKIDLLDHVIIGSGVYASLRERGYLY